MKVLKQSKFKNQIWKGECPRCDAVFECKRKEIEANIKIPTRMGMRDGPDYAHINCSECGASNVTFRLDRTEPEQPAPPTDGEVRP